MKKQEKTNDAVEILDTIVGDDPELRKMIEQQRINSHVAQIIYDARVAAELTQKELADLIGTSQSTIARLEDADYKGHSLTMLQRIAAALDRHVEIKLVHNKKRSKLLTA